MTVKEDIHGIAKILSEQNIEFKIQHASPKYNNNSYTVKRIISPTTIYSEQHIDEGGVPFCITIIRQPKSEINHNHPALLIIRGNRSIEQAFVNNDWKDIPDENKKPDESKKMIGPNEEVVFTVTKNATGKYKVIKIYHYDQLLGRRYYDQESQKNIIELEPAGEQTTEAALLILKQSW